MKIYIHMLFVENIEMTGMFLYAFISWYFVMSGQYGTTNLSSVMCSPYSEIISEAHICISLSHDTARGISVRSIL